MEKEPRDLNFITGEKSKLLNQKSDQRNFFQKCIKRSGGWEGLKNKTIPRKVSRTSTFRVRKIVQRNGEQNLHVRAPHLIPTPQDPLKHCQE